MNLATCFHPKKLVRKYSLADMNPRYRNVLYVPCGSCPACLNQKMLRAVSRIEDEMSKGYLYAYHVTLTFSDDSAHKIEFNWQDSDTIVARWCDWFTFKVDKDGIRRQFNLVWRTFKRPQSSVVAGSEYTQLWKDAERFANHGSSYHDNYLRFSEVRDVQLFLKRLRRKIEYHYGKGIKIRYYAVPEFSPSKMRPHWHIILWFEEFQIAKNLRRLVSEAWQYGFTKCKFVCGRTAKYVAKYINCIAYYPQIYKNKDVLPHPLSSRKPSIGNDEVPTSFIKEMYTNRTFDFVRKRDNGFEDVCLSSVLENRWFPKCREFNSLTHHGRVTRYSFYETCRKSRQFDPLDRHNYDLDDLPTNEQLKFVRSTDFDFGFTYEDYCNNVFPILGKSDYYVSKRVCEIAQFFNYSIDKVTSIIEDYYSHKELKNLKQFYEFQQDFARENPQDLKYLACLYPVALDDWCLMCEDFSKMPSGWSLAYYDAISEFGYGLDLDLTETNRFKYFNNPYVKYWKDTNIRMNDDNIKTKKTYEDTNIKP